MHIIKTYIPAAKAFEKRKDAGHKKRSRTCGLRWYKRASQLFSNESPTQWVSFEIEKQGQPKGCPKISCYVAYKPKKSVTCAYRTKAMPIGVMNL